jgi:hypothetical protein
MEGIFTIEVDDEIYDIRPLNLPPNGIHYGVCKAGVLQFIVQRSITYKGDHWGLAYPDLNLKTSRELVDSIVEKIHAYFT